MIRYSYGKPYHRAMSEEIHQLALRVPRRPRSFTKRAKTGTISKVGHHMSLCGYARSFKNLPQSHPTGAVRRVTTANTLELLSSSLIMETIARAGLRAKVHIVFDAPTIPFPTWRAFGFAVALSLSHRSGGPGCLCRAERPRITHCDS